MARIFFEQLTNQGSGGWATGGGFGQQGNSGYTNVTYVGHTFTCDSYCVWHYNTQKGSFQHKLVGASYGGGVEVSKAQVNIGGAATNAQYTNSGYHLQIGTTTTSSNYNGNITWQATGSSYGFAPAKQY